jgi:hypothetical protein
VKQMVKDINHVKDYEILNLFFCYRCLIML